MVSCCYCELCHIHLPGNIRPALLLSPPFTSLSLPSFTPFFLPLSLLCISSGKPSLKQSHYSHHYGYKYQEWRTKSDKNPRKIWLRLCLLGIVGEGFVCPFVVPLMSEFVGWFLNVPSLWIEPSTFTLGQHCTLLNSPPGLLCFWNKSFIVEFWVTTLLNYIQKSAVNLREFSGGETTL